MASLTETERVEILMVVVYSDRPRSNTVVAALFNETHTNRKQVSKSTVSKTLRRFNETGNVKGPGRCIGRTRAIE